MIANSVGQQGIAEQLKKGIAVNLYYSAVISFTFRRQHFSFAVLTAVRYDRLTIYYSAGGRELEQQPSVIAKEYTELQSMLCTSGRITNTQEGDRTCTSVLFRFQSCLLSILPSLRGKLMHRHHQGFFPMPILMSQFPPTDGTCDPPIPVPQDHHCCGVVIFLLTSLVEDGLACLPTVWQRPFPSRCVCPRFCASCIMRLCHAIQCKDVREFQYHIIPCHAMQRAQSGEWW